MRLPILAVALYAGAAMPAQSDAVGETLAKWGLTGTWAAECDRWPSRRNPYLAFIPDGGGRTIQRNDIGEAREDSRVVAVEIAADGALMLRLQGAGTAAPRSLMLIKAAHGVVRIVAEHAADGSVVVSNGIEAATGAATFWLTRCY